MLLSRFFRPALALALLASLSAGDVLTVGPAGSGAQFTQIQAAVNAAADDDVILVKPGTYQGITVTKPVRILGDPTVPAPTMNNVFVSPVVVRDIGAGKEVVLSGVTVFTGEPPILLRNCAGTVVLQDVVVPRSSDGVICMRIENCNRAVLLDSLLTGGIFDLVSPRGAIVVQSSQFWLANTSVSGTEDDTFVVRASLGIELADSTLHAWRSQIRGGDALGKAAGVAGLADGGVAIRAVRSTVNLFGGPGALVAGGHGHPPFFGPTTPGGSALDLAESSHARIQRDLPVSGGLHGNGVDQAPAIVVDGTSSFTRDPKVFPTLVSSAQQVQLGSTFSLTLSGNPGGYQVLFFSFRTGPTTIYRGVDGFGLLDRPNMRRLASEVLPASAAHTLSVRVPNMPSLIGATVFLQAAEQLGTSYAIGNPVLVTITG